MIKLHFWPTPNGYKPLIFLLEGQIEHELVTVNINKGDQYHSDFLRIAPNNRIPAIVDETPPDGGSAISLFESGAILEYLADRQGAFIGIGLRQRVETLQWLYWQVGGLGPMAGQNAHFVLYAPERLPYAMNRYINETERLYSVLEKRLADRDYITGEYSIADMACYPWAKLHEKQKQDIGGFPNIARWLERMANRNAVLQAYEIGQRIAANPSAATDAERAILFKGSHPSGRG